MTKNIPIVSQGLLTDDCAQGLGARPSIPLDSPAWFAWLDAPTTTSFSYALHNRAKGYIDGFMTVRKERRQRGGAYWFAYRRQGKRLRKLYLGRSATLTQARLQEVARQLRPRDGPSQNHTLSVPACCSGLFCVNHHC